MSAWSQGGRGSWTRVFRRRHAVDLDAWVQRQLAGLVHDERLPDSQVSHVIVENVLAGDGGRGVRSSVLRSVPLHTVPSGDHDARSRPSRARAMLGLSMALVAAAVLALVVVRPPARERLSPIAVHVSAPRTMGARATDALPNAVAMSPAPATPSCVALEAGKRWCWIRKGVSREATSEVVAVEDGDAVAIAGGSPVTALSFEFAGVVVFTEVVPEVTVAKRSITPPPAATETPERRSKPRSPEVFFSLGREALLRGQPREAASLYAELIRIHPRSAEARAATVALAEIDLHRLGRPKAAERLFREYLKGRGDDALALEARAGRIQALAQLGRTREEAAAIRDYLRHHANSGNAEALRQRLRQIEVSPDAAP